MDFQLSFRTTLRDSARPGHIPMQTQPPEAEARSSSHLLNQPVLRWLLSTVSQSIYAASNSTWACDLWLKQTSDPKSKRTPCRLPRPSSLLTEKTTKSKTTHRSRLPPMSGGRHPRGSLTLHFLAHCTQISNSRKKWGQIQSEDQNTNSYTYERGKTTKSLKDNVKHRSLASRVVVFQSLKPAHLVHTLGWKERPSQVRILPLPFM